MESRTAKKPPYKSKGRCPRLDASLTASAYFASLSTPSAEESSSSSAFTQTAQRSLPAAASISRSPAGSLAATTLTNLASTSQEVAYATDASHSRLLADHHGSRVPEPKRT